MLEGVFVSSPAAGNFLNHDIRIRVYSGEKKPDRLVYEQPYPYSYRYYGSNGFSTATRDMMHSVRNTHLH